MAAHIEPWPLRPLLLPLPRLNEGLNASLNVSLMRRLRQACAALALSALAACGTLSGRAPGAATSSVPSKASAQTQAANERAAGVPVLPPANSGRGGYYKDDGPGDNPPPGLQQTPDAEPKVEPYARASNKPYTVFGKTYTPILDNREFIERGVATWYGKKFHGQRTSSGEPYDMYKMTAAHPTLPIPSYARVTNLQNGAQVIVRINDRGPFHTTRIIDLSYTAALKLGYLGPGSREVQVERLLPAEIERLAAQRRSGVQTVAAVAVAAPATPVAAGPANNSVQAAIESMLRSDTPLPADERAGAPLRQVGSVQASAAADGKPRFYLQLGAFSQESSAELSRTSLTPVLGTLSVPAVVVRQGSLFKLLSGPFVSRGEAQDAASRLQAAPGWQANLKPMVIER